MSSICAVLNINLTCGVGAEWNELLAAALTAMLIVGAKIKPPASEIK